MLIKTTYGYYDPDEYTMICDICGHTVDEDCGEQVNDRDYCDKCYKEKMKEEKDDTDD
jgi:formylmethanofuran dehydrogenase subunit E